MRYLLLTRGMPFCGKTTWIQKYGLQHYTLCAKLFKNLTQSPAFDEQGNMTLVNHNDKTAFQMLFIALESRMSKGDFVIIEDNHIAKSYFSNYKEMARVYAYKIFIVDFSGVPLHEIKRRRQNAIQSNTISDSCYTEEELESLYNDLQTTQIPIKCDLIEPNEIVKFLNLEPRNLNGYKVIHHIGDIQGCFSVLKQYLHTMNDNEFYIFLGDYIDRGFQNYEVLKFLLSIMDKKNVCLLEGNHEKWLWEWANGREIESKEFRLNTQLELERKGFTKHDARRLYGKLIPYFYYKFHNKRVICTHGGVSNVPERPVLLSASQSIHGVGGYLNTRAIAESFAKKAPKNYYQFFGHRNKTELPICIYERNFIMESQVEFGGFLRAVQLTQNGFKNVSLRNTVFISKEQKEAKTAIQKFLDSLQKNKKVSLLTSKDYTIVRYPKKVTKDILSSAYAFSPCVIDTQTWQIAARGYHLDSNISNQYATNIAACLEKLHFPVQIFKQQRGIPALISYYNGRFLYFCDSVLQNSLPSYIRCKETQKKIIKTLKNQSYSLLLNLIDKDTATLIDVIANTKQLVSLDSVAIQKIISILKISSIRTIYTLYDVAQLRKFIAQVNAYNLLLAQKMEDEELCLEAFSYQDTPNAAKSLEDSHVDLRHESPTYQRIKANCTEYFNGFVVSDSIGSYFNIPTYYDNELKALEHFIKIWIVQGNISKLQWIKNPLRILFYQWFQDYARQNQSWQSTPIVWIQNEFLDFVIKRHNTNAIICS